MATMTPTVVSRPQPASAIANSATNGRAGEQERAVDGGADDQRGVDGGLEADRDTGQDHGGRTGQRGLADVLDRLVLGAGEVAGEPEDDAGQHDADDHRDGRDERRVAADVSGRRRRRRLGEGARQVDERGDRAQHRGDQRGDVEGPVDRGQAALARPGLGDVDADDRGDARRCAGTISGNSRPCAPNAVVPRISAATRVTA